MAQEHSFATPGPAGLAALAVACFGFGAVFLGKVGLEGLPLLAAWLVGGFIAPTLGGLKPPPLGGSFSIVLIKCRHYDGLSAWFPFCIHDPCAFGVDYEVS